MNCSKKENPDAIYFCEDKKPNVFLIGDSIRLGYESTLMSALKDEINVFSPEGNCQNTQFVIANICHWVKLFDCPEKINIVQFNCGHWDANHWLDLKQSLTSEGEYEKNIRMIIELIKRLFINARIVFATTTPINPSSSPETIPRSNDDIDRYNLIALKVAKEFDILINDLNSFAKGWDKDSYIDHCHFTDSAYEKLGIETAGFLKQIIYK